MEAENIVSEKSYSTHDAVGRCLRALDASDGGFSSAGVVECIVAFYRREVIGTRRRMG